MLSQELLRKIKTIELHTAKIVNSIFCGEYASAFKGHGMRFEEVREYNPGDEIRNIDWNVTARMNQPFVKQFREERELTLMILVDLSSSGNFSSSQKMKNELSAELTALLAYAAINTNDKVGLIIFTDKIELYLPPKKGVAHVFRLIKEILTFRPKSSATRIDVGIEYLLKVLRRKSLVVLISDFISEGYEDSLKHAAHKHDLVSLVIGDPRESDFPDVGLIELEDAETGETIVIDSGSYHFRNELKKRGEERVKNLKRLMAAAKVDHVFIRTDDSPVDKIVRLFKIRSKK